MRAQKSHSSGFLKLATFVAFPAVVALLSGVYLGLQTIHSKEDPVEVALLQDVQSQNHTLSEALWASVDAVRTRALSLYHIRAAQKAAYEAAQKAAPNAPTMTPTMTPSFSSPAGVLLHWAELEVHGTTVQSVKQYAMNPQWKGSTGVSFGENSSLESAYLQTLVEKISMREIKENGVSFVRFKSDSQNTSEWMALVFAVPGESSSLVAVLVDLFEAFPIFKKSNDPSLRSYLIASDGKIVAHSLSNYLNSNFSQSAIFNQAIRGLLQGTKNPGAAPFTAVDQLPVVASYARLGSLPYALVVERVANPVNLATKGTDYSAYLGLIGQLLAAFGFLMVLVLGIAYGLRKKNA